MKIYSQNLLEAALRLIQRSIEENLELGHVVPQVRADDPATTRRREALRHCIASDVRRLPQPPVGRIADPCRAYRGEDGDRAPLATQAPEAYHIVDVEDAVTRVTGYSSQTLRRRNSRVWTVMLDKDALSEFVRPGSDAEVTLDDMNAPMLVIFMGHRSPFLGADVDAMGSDCAAQCTAESTLEVEGNIQAVLQPLYTLTDENGERWAKGCEIVDAEDAEFVCLNDGTWVHTDRAIWAYDLDSFIHEDEACRCEGCEEYFSDSYDMTTIRSEHAFSLEVCLTCLENGDYVYIEDREGWYEMDEAVWSDASDQYVHVDDLDDEEEQAENHAYIHSYDADILNVLEARGSRYLPDRADRRGLRLFGLEVECDARDGSDAMTIAEAIVESADCEETMVFKHDGTCSGLELVTAPMTLEEHKDGTVPWADVLQAMRPVAKGHHASSSGIHIHVSKASLGRLTIAKLVSLHNTHSALPFLRIIAQRKFDEATYTSSDSDMTLGQDVTRCDVKHRNDHSRTRYCPVNVTEHTIEFRIFRSNLREDRVLKNLEYVQAVIEFVDTQSVRAFTKHDGPGLSARFCEFVGANADRFPNLYEFLSSSDDVRDFNDWCEALDKGRRQLRLSEALKQAASISASTGVEMLELPRDPEPTQFSFDIFPRLAVA